MTIVSRIGELVDERGWKITEFAEKADLAYNTAHDLYTGKASRIGLDILDRVCRVLETHPGELLIFVNDTPKPNKSRLKKPELV